MFEHKCKVCNRWYPSVPGITEFICPECVRVRDAGMRYNPDDYQQMNMLSECDARQEKTIEENNENEKKWWK